ncbi:alpha/beta-hydrolase, partial [Fistulina hepatica ATCC 64428]
LAHYSTPGVIPPSSRLPSDLRELQRQPLRVWQLWKYGLALTVKATQMTGDVLAHTIWGPRRKSWGIEMTLITSFMRGAGHHAALFDLGFVRAIASIGGLMPLPSDALVTPVTFRVKSRHLRGILSELDMTETGERLLSGEWIVGKHTWHRLQSEWKTARTENWSKPAKKEQVVLYVHGGAYYVSSAAAQRLLTIPLAKHSDARVFALDYRLAPETRFPGPLHDVVSAYFRLVDDLHIPPENIVVAGDSAGGGLAVALLMYLRDNKYPLPSGGILMSPWVDLTLSCASWDTNADYDVVPIPDPNSHMNPITCYLGGNVDAYIAHPYASPLFGDFTGLPPLLVQCGDAEVLRDEITLLAHKARSAGVDVRLELYQDAVHIFQMFPFLDASRRAFESIGAFVREVLPQNMGALDLSAERSLEREIENSDTKVVRGDGVETATRVDSISISDSDRESSRSYASWRVRSSDKHRLPSPPSSEDDDD